MSSPPAAAAAPQVLLSASYQRAAPRRGGGGVGCRHLGGQSCCVVGSPATTPPLSAAAGFILTAQPDLASFISPLRTLVFLQLLKRHLVCTEPPGELLHLQAQIQLPPLRAVGAPLGGEILALLRASCSPSPALQEPDAHLRGSLGAVSPRGAVPVPAVPHTAPPQAVPRAALQPGPRSALRAQLTAPSAPRCQHRGPGAAPGLSRAPGTPGTPRCQPRPPPPRYLRALRVPAASGAPSRLGPATSLPRAASPVEGSSHSAPRPGGTIRGMGLGRARALQELQRLLAAAEPAALGRALRRERRRLLLGLLRAAGPRPLLGLLLRERPLRRGGSGERRGEPGAGTAALLGQPGEELEARLGGGAGPGLEERGCGEHGLALPLPRPLPLPLPPAGHSAGADTGRLLAGSRARSAHSCCGHRHTDTLRAARPAAERGGSPRRVLSASKGKNKLPWESQHAAGKEGGSAGTMPSAKGVQQFPPSGDFLHSPKLRPSQGTPGSEELFFSRKRPPRNLFQNSVDFNSEHSSVCAGAMGSHQPHISGKCGTLGCTQTRGKSGSVDSDLQFLGLNNGQQDRVCASLNFSSKTQRSFCNQSYPLSSPRTSPKHVSSPADSPKKSQDNTMNFSNSWPLKSFEGLPKPRSQKHLHSQKSGDNTGDDSQEKHSPLQLKPALVRHPASRRGLNGTRPVPPILRLASPLPDKIELNMTKWKNEECEDTWVNGVGRKLAADLSELTLDGEEVDQEEMQSSLRSLRNSAAKKRAKLTSNISDLESPDSALKLDLSGDSSSHASSPSVGSCSESGVYSQESLTSPISTVPQRKRIMSDTFPLLGSKSQPARVSSARNRDANVAEHNSSTGISLWTSNVSIVGQRLNCGNGCGDYEDKKQKEGSRSIFKSQNMEQQRNFKHSKVFAGSTSGFQQMNNLDFISPSVLSEDAVVVVGKGVFGSPSAQTHSQSIARAENGDDQSAKQETEPPSGICRRSIQQSSASHFHAENEKEVRFQDWLFSYFLICCCDLDISFYFLELDLYGDVLASSRNVSSSLENVALNPSLKRTSSLKKTKCSPLLDSDEISLGPRGRYKERTPSVTHSPEIMDPSELQPFSKPETALTEALVLLADDDWEKKIEGLNFVRCLSAYHAAILTVKLHETSLAVAQEVKNLRSGVSRAAVVCLGDLFTHLKKSMDQELDNTVKVLLHKAGESNTFIREEVDKALKAMVNNVTPARALCSLINGGQSHLHAAVRRCTAQHMSDIVERMGPEWMLAGTKVVTDRIFPAIARFTLDSSQQTRYYGRKMLFSMMNHPDFDKTLEKYVPAKDLPYIKEFVSNLRQKGLGEMPLDTPSAKGRRSHTSIVGHSRSSSTSRDALSITDRETTEAREVTRKAAPRNSIESEEYVKDIIGLLNAKDFRDRINGINQLLSDTENNQDFVVANIVKIFDAFKPRLHDSNSKVNQVALETMYKMIPLLKDNLSPVINMLVPAMVDNNLNSKNPGIYAAATNVIQALCQHLDNYLLLQPFCTKAQFLHGKAKQDITEKLADLVAELYPRKPQAVEQKVLAVLWHLLGTGDIRAATAKLSRALFAQMGPGLLARAAGQPPHVRRSLEEVLELPA
uniref:TOG array regulator of axonemal microtubules 1 n=1 Tax=Anas platyrhynchos TaxID=8839 RepID=A0A8B9ZGG8_ANAPL